MANNDEIMREFEGDNDMLSEVEQSIGADLYASKNAREIEEAQHIEDVRKKWLANQSNNTDTKDYAGFKAGERVGDVYEADVAKPKEDIELETKKNYVKENFPKLNNIIEGIEVKLNSWQQNKLDEVTGIAHKANLENKMKTNIVKNMYTQAENIINNINKISAVDDSFKNLVSKERIDLLNIKNSYDLYNLEKITNARIKSLEKQGRFNKDIKPENILKKFGRNKSEEQAIDEIMNIIGDSPTKSNMKIEEPDGSPTLDYAAIDKDNSVKNDFLKSISGTEAKVSVKKVLDPNIKVGDLSDVDVEATITINEKLSSDDIADRITMRDNLTNEQINANYNKVADIDITEKTKQLETLKETINAYNKNISALSDVNKSIEGLNVFTADKNNRDSLIKWFEAQGKKTTNPKYNKVVDLMTTMSEVNAFENLNDSQEAFVKSIVDKFNEMGVQEGQIDLDKFGTYMHYVPHTLTPELKNNPTARKMSGEVGFDLEDPFNKNKMTRKLQGTINDINQLMKNEYPDLFGDVDFFETNIMRILGERQLYSNNIQTKRHIASVFKNFEITLPGFKGKNNLNKLNNEELDFMAQQLGIDIEIPEMKQGMGKSKRVVDLKDKNELFDEDPNKLGATVRGKKWVFDKKTGESVYKTVDVPFSERDTVDIMPNQKAFLTRQAIADKITAIVNGKDERYTLVRKVEEIEEKQIKRVKDEVLNRDKPAELEKGISSDSDLSYEDLTREDIESYEIQPVFEGLTLEDTIDDVMTKITNQEYVVMDKNALNQYNKMMKHMSSEQKNKALQIYDKAMNMFKAYAVFSPSFHLNNFIGNSFNSVIQTGLKVFSPSNTKNTWKLLSDFKKVGYDWTKLEGSINGIKRSDLMEQAVKGGMLNGFFDNDLGGTRNFLNGKGSLGSSPLAKLNPLDSQNFAPLKGSKKLGEFIEERSKIANYLAHIDSGKSMYEATDLTNAALFDYGDLTDFEEGVIKRYVAPFYTFAKKNAEFQFEILANKPMGHYMTSRAIRYQEENETDKDRMLRPEYVSGTKVGEGKYLNADTPLQSFTNLSNPKNIYNMANPIAKTLIDLAYNKKTYSGAEISATGNPIEQGQYVAESLLPVLRTAPKMFGWLSSDKSKKEDSINWWFGNKVQSYDIPKAEKQAMYDYVEELQDKYYKILSKNPELKDQLELEKAKQNTNKNNTPLGKLLGL